MKNWLLAAAFCVGIAVASPAGAQTGGWVEGMVISEPVTSADTPGRSLVSVRMLTQGRVATIKTEAVSTTDVPRLTANLVTGALVGYQRHATQADVARVAADAQTFASIYRAPFSNGEGARAYTFDTMKYGPELPPVGPVPGRMAAAGWIYAKNTGAGTIAVGDGRIVTRDWAGRAYDPPIKRYEETYRLAGDVVVYNVNTDNYEASTVARLSDVPVTADYKYSTTTRQQVYAVFDKNYLETKDARVTALYYFTPQSITTGRPVHDLGTSRYNSSFNNVLGVVPAEESPVYAGMRYADIPYEWINYEVSTAPFAVIPDRLYSVGDSDTGIWLFTIGNRILLIDAGRGPAGYQYWKNIEAMGFDPRKITDLMLTHAHADHNGTAVELITMIENAGGTLRLWGSREEQDGIRTDAHGNSFAIRPELAESQTDIRRRTSVFYEHGKTYDLGDVKITAHFAPGHTVGVYNFLIDMLHPGTGNWVRVGYNSGFGWNSMKVNNENGGRRLQFLFGLQYWQQIADTGMILFQHTDMAPQGEAHAAVEAYNRDPANAKSQKTVWDVMTTTTGGVNELENMLEKRIQSFFSPYSDSTNFAQTVTNFGPFKPGRENGLHDTTVKLLDGGKIIRGFNKHWLINDHFPLLKDGVVFGWEAYVHDPDAYYVQFYLDVQDSYQGFIPEGYAQTIDGKKVTYKAYPVESIHPNEGTPEVLRTRRLASLAEAEAIVASVSKGGRYKIDLTKASEIIVPADVTKTFRAP